MTYTVIVTTSGGYNISKCGLSLQKAVEIANRFLAIKTFGDEIVIKAEIIKEGDLTK